MSKQQQKQFKVGDEVFVRAKIIDMDDTIIPIKVMVECQHRFWITSDSAHLTTPAPACEPEALCWEDVEYAMLNTPNIWTACNHPSLTLTDWTTGLDRCIYRHKDTHAAVSAESLLAAVNRAKAHPTAPACEPEVPTVVTVRTVAEAFKILNESPDGCAPTVLVDPGEPEVPAKRFECDDRVYNSNYGWGYINGPVKGREDIWAVRFDDDNVGTLQIYGKGLWLKADFDAETEAMIQGMVADQTTPKAVTQATHVCAGMTKTVCVQPAETKVSDERLVSPAAPQVVQAAEVYAGMQRQEFWCQCAAECIGKQLNGHEWSVGDAGFSPRVYEVATREAGKFADAMLAEFDKRFGKGGE